MRLTMPASYRQLGPVCIMQQIDVLELESRSRPPKAIPTRPISAAPPVSSEILLRNQDLQGNGNPGDTPSTVGFSNQTLETIFGQMVIIVPCKNEDPKTVRNVLRGIPATCAVLLVSNCADGYTELSAMLENICKYGRQAILVHQKYQGAALAFGAVGVPQLLDPLRTDTIRDGKGEGMYLGIAMARTFFPERQYVGFVDADNQVPGSVNEYCRVYAAGFLLSHQYSDAGEEQVMVRISWQCKPKVRNGQISYDEPEGRSSRVVNSWLNRLFAKPFGDDSKFITTGNAGEHAMTMDMALGSRWANGYAIETYQFLDPFLPPTSNLSSATTNGIRGHNSGKPRRILQIRTLNPHLHRQGDDLHILRMWAAGLGVIWHNLSQRAVIPGIDQSTLDEIRTELVKYAVENGGLAKKKRLPRPRVYPALNQLDFDEFKKVMTEQRNLQSYGAPLFFGFDDCEQLDD
ncbi:mannosyl-3-phosphoglycerate synthase [Cladorrhinum sp. PSN259]|nr:mannosyl-3-phosphoglycerate synthase [Cladorrhinum sp. PSN259]